MRSSASLITATELSHRAGLAAAIPRRPRVTWWFGLLLATAFSLVVLPSITAERWLMTRAVSAGEASPITIRVAPFAGSPDIKGGGILVARGATPGADEAAAANRLLAARPHGPLPVALYFALVLALGFIMTHHLRRSVRGRLVRVQIVSLAAIAVLAIAVKVMLLLTTVSILVVPVAALALVPTLTLDRIVGLATGVLGALVVALVGPFDVGVAILLLVQVAVAGLVVAEGPKHRTRHALWAGGCATAATALTYPLFLYLALGHAPFAELADPLHSPWVAATLGPALGTVLAIVFAPLYQLLVGEITHGKLIELEDLSNPLLRQIAERAPGTWQHSLMMANLAEIAANAIGASGRLVRVGAYYHDLGKSLQPKYFIENLEPGETSPHDQLPPEVSCDAIFAHVTEGIVAARRAGLHERIVDFMHMHHGNGVLEYFWAKAREQGNPHGLTIEQFRYPGHPPQSRETAILAICDAVEAASRTLKKTDPASIDSLVQRIVYGKLHLGQLDESGLSMGDLRRVADSLRETIRHANHNRIEYPWQKAEQSASASTPQTTTDPRLDSLDRPAKADSGKVAKADSGKIVSTDALADTAGLREPEPVTTPRPVEAPATTKTGMAVRKVDERVTTPFERKSGGGLRQTLDDRGVPPGGSAAAGLRGVIDDRGVPPGGSAAAGLRGVLDDRGVPPGGSAAAGLRGVIDKPTKAYERKPDLPTTPFQRNKSGGLAAVDDRGLPPGGSGAEGRRGVIDPPQVIEIEVMTPPPREAAPVHQDEPIHLEPAARKRAATLPPLSPRRAPTVPPPVAPGRKTPSVPPVDQILTPVGPPTRDPERAKTNPPYQRTTGLSTEPNASSSVRITLERLAVDAGVTDPGIPSVFTDVTRPRLEMPLIAPQSNPEIKVPPPDWAKRLAARIDAEIDNDFGGETPVVAPTKSQLQALISGGNPDVTKKQSLDDLERLRSEAEVSEVEILRKRIDPTHELSSSDLMALAKPVKPPPRKVVHTEEVDPDDIESAIEVAPPARRPATAIGVAKKKPDQ